MIMLHVFRGEFFCSVYEWVCSPSQRRERDLLLWRQRRVPSPRRSPLTHQAAHSTVICSFLCAQRAPRKRRREQFAPASTAGEAIERMLVEKKISSKINYDVLRDLDKVWENSDNSSKAAKLPTAEVEETLGQEQDQLLITDQKVLSGVGNEEQLLGRSLFGSNRLPSLRTRKRTFSALGTDQTSQFRYTLCLSVCLEYK